MGGGTTKINPQDFAKRIRALSAIHSTNFGSDEVFTVFKEGNVGCFLASINADAAEGEVSIYVGGVKQGSFTFYADYRGSYDYTCISANEGRVWCYHGTGAPSDLDAAAEVVCAMDGRENAPITLTWTDEEPLILDEYAVFTIGY